MVSLYFVIRSGAVTVYSFSEYHPYPPTLTTGTLYSPLASRYQDGGPSKSMINIYDLTEK